MTTPTKSLRLIAILDIYPSLSETFLYITLQNLQNIGIQVVVYARKRGKAPHKDIGLQEIHFLPSEKRPLAAKALRVGGVLVAQFLRSPGQAARLVTTLREHNPNWRNLISVAFRISPLLSTDTDLVYFSHGGLAAKFVEYIHFSGNSIFSLRGSDINIKPLLSAPYRNRLRKAIQHARGIHCVCKAIQKKAEKLAGAPQGKMSVVYTSLNPLFLEATRERQDSRSASIRIVSVGRLNWRKGYEHGLMAIRALVQRGISCYWTIIGDGPHRQPLQWSVKDMGLEGVVTFAGGQDQQAVLTHLLESDIYFHPSVHEGVSNAVLEAMAAGLPAVAAHVGGMGEAITSGENGYLVPPRDWSAMADALEKLARDPELRQRIAASGQSHVRRSFTPELQQAAFQGFFSQSLEGIA